MKPSLVRLRKITIAAVVARIEGIIRRVKVSGCSISLPAVPIRLQLRTQIWTRFHRSKLRSQFQKTKTKWMIRKKSNSRVRDNLHQWVYQMRKKRKSQHKIILLLHSYLQLVKKDAKLSKISLRDFLIKLHSKQFQIMQVMREIQFNRDFKLR